MTLTPEERSERLAQLISQYAREGWRVESQSATQAQLVKGKPTNHVLHLLLSLVTLGIWIPVWICVAIFGGEKHKLVTVNERGVS